MTVERPTQPLSSKTGMLIRRPVGDVFEAIVNPDITTRFWFTRSSGRLETGAQLRWEWEMYGVTVPVTVKVIDPNTRIVIEWPGYSGPTIVEWTLAPRSHATTFVEVSERGFAGSGVELVKQVADSTEGFSLMLAGLKALLEHDVELGLVRDRYPQGTEH